MPVHVGGLPGADELVQQASYAVLAERRQLGLLRAPWVRSSSEARARCSALFTLGTEVSSSSATSAAENWSTSRSTSTARWVPGRCCSAATNASSTPSRRAYAASGSPASSGSSAQGSRNRCAVSGCRGRPSA